MEKIFSRIDNYISDPHTWIHSLVSIPFGIDETTINRIALRYARDRIREARLPPENYLIVQLQGLDSKSTDGTADVFEKTLAQFMEDNKAYLDYYSSLTFERPTVDNMLQRCIVDDVRAFLTNRTEETFRSLIVENMVNSQQRTFVFIDCFHKIPPTGRLGRMFHRITKESLYPSLLFATASGTWDSSQNTRVAAGFEIAVDPLSLFDCRTIVRELGRDHPGVVSDRMHQLMTDDALCLNLSREFSGHMGLLWAWVTHPTDEQFRDWARADARNRCDRALQRSRDERQLVTVIAELISYFRSRATLLPEVEVILVDCGLWDAISSESRPIHKFARDELHRRVCDTVVDGSKPKVLRQLIEFDSRNREFILEMLFWTRIQEIRRSRSGDVLPTATFERFVRWRDDEEVCSQSDSADSILIAVPPSFLLIDFLGYSNGRVYAIQVSPTPYDKTFRCVKDLFTMEWNRGSEPFRGRTLYEIIRLLFPQAQLKAKKRVEMLPSDKRFPKNLTYVYASPLENPGTTKGIVLWGPDVLETVLGKELFRMIRSDQSAKRRRLASSVGGAGRGAAGSEDDDGEDEEEEEGTGAGLGAAAAE